MVQMFRTIIAVVTLFPLVVLASDVKVREETKVLIHWGYPVVINEIHVIPIEDWTSCVRFCKESHDCVAVSSENKHDTRKCTVHFFGQIESIQRSNGLENNNIFALKVDYNTGCHSEEDSYPAYGSTTTGNYNATLNKQTNTISLNFNYSNCFPNKNETWFPIMRPYGVWCIFIARTNETFITRDFAKATCENQEEANLTGVQTPFESVFITNFLAQHNMTSIWIDGDRADSCKNVDGTAKCDTFIYNNRDINETVNTELFFPSSYQNNYNSDCILLMGPVNENGMPIKCGSSCLSTSMCQSLVSGHACGKMLT